MMFCLSLKISQKGWCVYSLLICMLHGKQSLTVCVFALFICVLLAKYTLMADQTVLNIYIILNVF